MSTVTLATLGDSCCLMEDDATGDLLYSCNHSPLPLDFHLLSGVVL